MNDRELQKHIRCKCGKFWGMRNLRKHCKRCKTTVMSRGEIGNGK